MVHSQINSIQQADLASVALTPIESDKIDFKQPSADILTSLRNLGDLDTAASAEKTCIVGESYKRGMRNRQIYITVQVRFGEF